MDSPTGIAIRRPPGIIAGLTAAWAIFGLFLALGDEMGGEPGALFQMVGVAFGIDTSYAVYIGFLLYMITAVIIGIIYSAITKRIKILYINSVLKAVGTGILAGIIVWGSSVFANKLFNYGTNSTKVASRIRSFIFTICNGKKPY